MPVHAIPVLRQVEVALQRRHTRSPDHALGNGARQIRQRLTFSSPWWRFSSSASRASAICSSHPQWQSRAPACSFKLLNLTPILAGKRRALRGAQFIGGPWNGPPPSAFPTKELKFSGESAPPSTERRSSREKPARTYRLYTPAFQGDSWRKMSGALQIRSVAQFQHFGSSVATLRKRCSLISVKASRFRTSGRVPMPTTNAAATAFSHLAYLPHLPSRPRRGLRQQAAGDQAMEARRRLLAG